ncbi:MAG: hypothetical protein IJX71_00070 [Oscillospiraceae bacterium]|nr:hypothetical protein [Oscillospiraceae bacterium]
MSYVCLMANDSGAVVAGDTLLTELHNPHSFHSPTSQGLMSHKCDVLKEDGMIWARCGLNHTGGIHVGEVIRECLSATELPVTQRLDNISRRLAPLTARVLDNGSTSSIFLFLAQRKNKVTSIWDFRLVNGRLSLDPYILLPGTVYFRQGGLHTSRIKVPDYSALRTCSFETLRALARRQVELAIAVDEELERKDLNYVRQVGGEIIGYGIKLKK